MDIKKIYTFGDGYASNHIWPEWPWILELLYPEIEFSHFGEVGAGNEYISNAVIQANLNDPDAYFLVQWTEPHRFDKLLQDKSWDTVIDADPVYFFNRVSSFGQNWWISSKSTQPEIVQYHKQFVQPAQHILRSANVIYLISQLLAGKSLFFSTVNINYFLHRKPNNYIEQDMFRYSFLAQFSDVRQNEVQPSPVVHLEYIKEYILPRMPVSPNKSCLDKLTRLVNEHKWVPYHPDREEIWKNIKRQLKILSDK
jgi:hypothetical protein